MGKGRLWEWGENRCKHFICGKRVNFVFAATVLTRYMIGKEVEQGGGPSPFAWPADRN